MLVSMDKLLNKAKKEKYAVASANVFNDRSVKACFEAAESLNAPIIISATSYVPMEEIASLVNHYKDKYEHVSVSLNLDHGADFDAAMRAVRCGFTSVMIDKSTLPFEENIRYVKEVVRAAHPVGVSVEAELGHVGKGFEYDKTRDSGLTRPEEASEYVKRTEVDALAVAVGTSHGVYKGTPKLDFGLLKKLNEAVDIPLVLHGGSGTGDEKLRKAVETGIQKVNLSTDLSSAYIKSAGEYINNEGEILDEEMNVIYKGNRTVFVNTCLDKGLKGYKDLLVHYIELFGGRNKA
ncbi:class II fructose-bisphosphate aldolase [uncultured Anaerofustis sp.]|uniref:class II fructose-bisphosphate aldolase n=1 Tax=uncultured Anaerofustis sp. TaxID=904996 RepID=UPI0025F24199|nr:class II fructose-bisphosphate aldolase [uncultured Anaerofustis sp.]